MNELIALSTKALSEASIKIVESGLTASTEAVSELNTALENGLSYEAFNNQAETILSDPITCNALQEACANYEHLPKTNGEWEGEMGNSLWKPSLDFVPQALNPMEENWGELLSKYNIDGITFENGEPNFKEIAKDSVKIDDFTSERNLNYTQADENLSEKWNSEAKDNKEWTPQDIKDYRNENDLSWHERSDMKTMDLVPRNIHANIPHSGGISEAKKIGK